MTVTVSASYSDDAGLHTAKLSSGVSASITIDSSVAPYAAHIDTTTNSVYYDDFTFGTAPCLVEVIFKRSSNALPIVSQQATNNAYQPGFYLQEGSATEYHGYTTNGFFSKTCPSKTTGQYYKLSLLKNGTSLDIFHNGVSIGTTTVPSDFNISRLNFGFGLNPGYVAGTHIKSYRALTGDATELAGLITTSTDAFKIAYNSAQVTTLVQNNFYSLSGNELQLSLTSNIDFTSEISLLSEKLSYLTSNIEFNSLIEFESNKIDKSSIRVDIKNTLYAYPYLQYEDDAGISAFFTAATQMMQDYLDYLINLNFPIYTQHSGHLLNWVGEYLYGIKRPQVTWGSTYSLGEYDTWTPLQIAINEQFTYDDSGYSLLTDDAYKRVITWNFYKGDGNRVSIPWLKRRILRFLFGFEGRDRFDPVSDAVRIDFENQLINIRLDNMPSAYLFKYCVDAGIISLPFEEEFIIHVA